MSSDLLWSILRSQSSFIVKRPPGIGGVEFTREPNNLMNVNSYKYSGLAQSKVVSITPASNKRGAIITSQSKNGKKKSTALTKGPRRTAFTVADLVARSGYRPDLRVAALARASAILRSQRPKKELKKRPARGRRAAKRA
jgi:large subunit ribosomal protein L28e